MLKKFFKKFMTVFTVMLMLTIAFSMVVFANDGSTVATVTVRGGVNKDFDSFEKAWVYALEQSLEKPTTFTLLADWVAPDGKFYCTNDKGSEFGTQNGALYMYYNYLDFTIDLNGHKIDRNLQETTSFGHVLYLDDLDIKLTIKDSIGGGKITGGNTIGNGGGIKVIDGSLYIESGEISGNHATGNGGGVYWYSDSTFCMTGGIITGNTAGKNGGGICNDGGGWDVKNGIAIFLGGDAKIYGNSGAGSENSNLYLNEGRYINHTAGRYTHIPNAPFTDEAVIGISAHDTQKLIISGVYSLFNWGDEKHFFSDSDKYYIGMVYDASEEYNSNKMFIDAIENKPDDSNYVMSVVAEGGSAVNFSDFGKAWVYALKQSLSKPTTITLLKDWVAENGSFCCIDEDGDEYGTKNGRLFLYDNYVLTIDLNGHTIDRNLKEAKSSGSVFYLEDKDIKLTIKDSAGGGKITGGNCTGNGGGIDVYDGSLYIEGGEITGNKADNGAGIYWFSDNTLCITGGVISGNTAVEEGGGIYHRGGGDFGSSSQGSVYLGGDAQIYGNSGKGSENNNLYIYEGRYIYRTAGQNADIPNVLLTDKAVIGLSAYNTDSLISGSDSRFNWGDEACFFYDSDKYYIKMVYDAAGGNNSYKLYIDLAANKPVPQDPVMTVTVDGGVTVDFADFGKGWGYALKQSLAKPTTVTLLTDWIAENGSFYCTYDGKSEYGSKNGYLYINDDHILTIDLNGHKIDRNLSEAKANGVVFWLFDYDAKITIKDSVGGGKITGGNNTDKGGAFFVERGSLYIESGEISGNKAKNGAGIYWESNNNLCIYGGKITGNTATENGGGVYGGDYGPIYLGGDVVISGNTGANGKNNNLYLENDNVVLYRTARQAFGIPEVPFAGGASIGITAADSDNALITAEYKNCFNYSDYKYFFADDSACCINFFYVPDSSYEKDVMKMYIDSIENYVKPPKLEGGNLTGLTDDLAHSFRFDEETQTIYVTYSYKDAAYINSEANSPDTMFFMYTDFGREYSDFVFGEAPEDWTITNTAKFYLLRKFDNWAYSEFTVVVDWICDEHVDNYSYNYDGTYSRDGKCDICGEFITDEFMILRNDHRGTVKVYAPEDGRYTVIFANYADNLGKILDKCEMQEYDFKEGINTVIQKADWYIKNGSKVFIWDMTNGQLKPMCEEFIVIKLNQSIIK